MKKTLRIVICLLLLLSVFGCSGGSINNKEVPVEKTVDFTFDDLVIHMPEADDYVDNTQEEYDANEGAYIYSDSKAVSVDIFRYDHAGDPIDPESFLSLVYPELEQFTSGEFTYVRTVDEDDDEFYEFVTIHNNEYYSYFIAVYGYGEDNEVNEAEALKILEAMEVDKSAVVEAPPVVEVSNDEFTFKELVFSFPAEMGMSVYTSTDENIAYELVSEAGDYLLFVNYVTVSDALEVGLNSIEDMKEYVFEDHPDYEIAESGIPYYFYDTTTESGSQFFNCYSLIGGTENYYDVYQICFKDDEAVYRDFMLEVLNSLGY